ncbi:TonB-dependent receptor plug domain-containing protein [Ereboglobus luteus]|uniref:TonB-dependent receptor plug domain-containing protein n=1 Tax=Ereboglobus luteus TaxID=1796921 RepID=A0A2U8E4V7_9BACT|nr:TonB-dependent receptor plug domain-containing protein [Ereboglobus luteus]AWI09584.1 hypothetical protein CKA38_10315 [Ereboglobus luteus]
MNTKKYLRLGLVLVSGLVIIPHALVAQAVAPVPAAQSQAPVNVTAAERVSAGDEVVELSPFVVQGERDTGYAATDSLAGTRFRTPLKDIAASISVVTKDLMDDLGANTLEDLLIYTPGTEVMGIGGNYSGSYSKSDGSQNFEDQRDSATTTTRVRGLAAADQTRNFFLSPYIPMDGYNTQSVTVNRGANAILFGFGSPAGIIENSLIAPMFKNRGNARFSFGSYDTYRLSLDVERVLVKDKLSVRVAMLDDNRRYEQEFSFRDQERYYGAVTYKPFKYTSLRVNAEHGHIDQRMPRLDPPLDSLTTWWDFDQPTRTNDFTAKKTLDPARGVETAYQRANNLDGMAGNWSSNPALVYFSADDAVHSDSYIGYVNVPADYIGLNNGIGTYRFLAPRSSREIAQNVAPVDPLANFTVAKQITDRSIFDYRTYMIDGPNSGLWIDFDSANIAVEQLFRAGPGGRGGVEAVYDYQHSTSSMHRTLNGYRGNNIFVDVNTVTIDGRPNPNFGRPFLSSSGMYNHIDNKLKTWRGTAFFQYDFNEHGNNFLLKLLGVQSFNLMGSRYKRVQNLRSGYNAVVDPAFSVGTANNNSLGTYRKITNIVYLGPSLYGADSAAGANLPGVRSTMVFPSSVDVRTLNPTTGYVWGKQTVPVYTYEDDYAYTTNTRQRDISKVESVAFVWQGNWMDNMLVSTLGWRKDTDRTQKGPGTGKSIPADPITKTVSLSVPMPMGDVMETEADTFSYGLALHVPPRWFARIPSKPTLSLYYNKSENFDVGAGMRVDILGDRISPQQGKTKEYGFRVSAFDNRFSLRATWYETTQNNMTDTRVQVTLNRVYDLEMQLMENMPKAQLDAAGYVGYDSSDASNLFLRYLANYQWREYSVRDDGTRDISGPVTPSGIAATTRSVSKGVEIEAVFNPTKNWRIMFNAARQKATRGETSALLDALISDRLPQWQNPAIWEFDLSTVQRVDRYVTQYITGPMTTAKLSNGEWTPELREWRVNVVTNYNFDRESFLKGWGIGGAMRWQDKVGIGYPVIENPDWKTGMAAADKMITDVKNPFMGPSLTTFDAWLSYRRKIWKGIEWKIQLNIRNLFNKNLFIPVKANPVTLNDINTYEVAAYRIGAERTYEITSTFSF